MKLLIILLLVILLFILNSKYKKLENFFRSLLNKNAYRLPNEVMIDTVRISTEIGKQKVFDKLNELGYSFKRKFVLSGETQLHLFTLNQPAESLIELLTKGEDGKTAPAEAVVELEGGLYDDLLDNYLVLFPGQRLTFPSTGNLFAKCKDQRPMPSKPKNRRSDDIKQSETPIPHHSDNYGNSAKHSCLQIMKANFRAPSDDTGLIFNQGELSHQIKLGLIDSKSDFSQFSVFEEILAEADGYQQYLNTENFDGLNLSTPEDHGTMMASIIASNYAEHGQLKIRNYPFHDGTIGHLMEVIAAIYSAVADGVYILNLSLGYQQNISNGHLRRAIQYAGSQDVLVVCAAGNSNANNDVNKFWPANFSHMNHVVSVAAVDHLGNPWKENADMGTNFGASTVTFATDGDEVVGFVNAIEKKQLSGTSCAAAVLSAFAANLKSSDMTLSAPDLKQQLISQIDTGTGIFSINIPAV
jgi:hypothetical protein